MCLEYPLITRYIQGNEHIVYDISQNKSPISNITFFKSKWGQALDVKDAYVFKIFKDSKLLRSLSDCNWTRTHIHVVSKQTLNNLANLARPVWLNG